MSITHKPSAPELSLHAMRLVRDRVCTERSALIKTMQHDYPAASADDILEALASLASSLPKESTPKEAEPLELTVGNVYRGKRPAATGSMCNPMVNDRQIIWLGAYDLQYDSPSVRPGGRYPRVSIADFLKWADKDVTAEMPKDDWASWTNYQAAKSKAAAEAKAAKHAGAANRAKYGKAPQIA